MKAIEIKNLTKYYGKSKGIVNLSFDVEEGEIFGFIGPNGAGKSTTLRTLMNLIFPTSGAAKIFGLDIIKDSKKIKEKTGYLPAECNYYHKMTVRNLLEYSARFYKLENHDQAINNLCEILSLDQAKKISDLSSGNKKKVSIVQSLLHKPQLLILDEPTSGLDPLVQSAFYDLLNEYNSKGMTIFFSSHVLSEVQKICDRVAIIRKGKIIRVEHIETMKKNLLKKISIVTKDDISGIENFGGVKKYEIHDDRLSFMFDGDINELVKYLSDFNIDNLSVEEPALEDIFMHFYENDHVS